MEGMKPETQLDSISKRSIIKLVGIRIRSIRMKKGLTQADLAARVGTSQAKISHYELGTKQPEIVTLDRVAAGLGVEISELLKE